MISWSRIAPLLLCLHSPSGIAAVIPEPLAGVDIPATPGLLNGKRRIVVDRDAAIRLGKALFWDIGVGSDGMACGSCHFHAGADRRTRNQLNSGQLHRDSPTSSSFETTASGSPGGPDYQLQAADFPFHQLRTPSKRGSAVVFSTDDVVGSAGSFSRSFQDGDGDDSGNDRCAAVPDPLFRVGSANGRQVTNRNAPSVINAAFNFRNFWDGRANNLFNGSSSFGARDPDAGVWVWNRGKLVRQRILLKNASLASLAIGPPLNAVEMSCSQRSFLDLARKLLPRRPLEHQQVDPEDSVLGALRHPGGQGLDTTYLELVRQSFAPRFWGNRNNTPEATGIPGRSQTEENFPLFFGLAIQLYLDTLVSDQSLFDSTRDADNVPLAFDPQQKRGLSLFMDNQCVNCHVGPTLSAAAHPQVILARSKGYLPLVGRTGMFEELDGVGVAITLHDMGFLPTSVTPPEQDIGLAGHDPWNHPYSFSVQYQQALAEPDTAMVDPIRVTACEFSTPFTEDFASPELLRGLKRKQRCGKNGNPLRVPSPSAARTELEKPGQGRLMVTVQGAFKIPSLRNVELTGPYMHNGGMKTLEEVVDFYDRGGNGLGNPQHPETLIFPRGFSQQDKADLVAFLKTLTDERVRWERAPFDHPELLIPEGHEVGADHPLGTGLAADRYLHVPAVGRNGRSTTEGPLRPFADYLQP